MTNIFLKRHIFLAQISLGLGSFLATHAPLIQHLVALAHVHALRGQPERAHLDFRIKWPNDIYFGSRTKIGGVIVKSSVLRDSITVTIGAGINLDNQLPTVSINQILRDSCLNVLDQEVFLAQVFNCLEEIIWKCSSDQYSEVESLYYKYWLHGDQEIRVQDRDTERRVTVVGIDQFGFLRVKDADDVVFSVMDDGNSFDMMEGLVKPKER